MKMTAKKIVLGLTLTAAMLLGQPAQAQILLSSGTYTQNFDTLISAGSASWLDNSTLPGWFAAKLAGTGYPAVSTYLAGYGAANSGAIYSYGLTNDSNRALGALGSGTPKTQYFGAVFTNDTASAQSQFKISYIGEEWRSPSIVSNEFLAFSYRVADSAEISDVDATNDVLWTTFSPLTFTIPETVNISNTALDGTNPTNQVAFTDVELSGVTLQPGQALFIRWRDIDDAGSDAGLAIDNVTVSFSEATSGPVPAYVASQPTSQSVYVGDSASFSILPGGDSPFTYQWYSTNSSGVTLLADKIGATLNLSYVTSSDATGYFCAVTNSVGGTNSSIAYLTVNVRTPITNTISYLHTLVNPTTYAPIDTTNLYTVQGVVITTVNMTGSGHAQFYVQDGASAITVFISGGAGLLPAVGDRVELTGPMGQFYGQLELNMNASNPSHIISVLSNGNPLPTPTTLSLSDTANAAYMKSVESSLVVVSNVFMQTGSGYFISGSTVYMTNLSSAVFPIYISPYVYDVVAYSIPEFADSVTGVLAQHATGSVYTNGFQLVMRQYSDLVAGVAPILPIPLTPTFNGSDLTLEWTDSSFVLQCATNVVGPYVDVVGATSPFTTNAVTSEVPAQFFRLYHNP